MRCQDIWRDLNRVIVAQIEENDKVRSVYGGSVGEVCLHSFQQNSVPTAG